MKIKEFKNFLWLYVRSLIWFMVLSQAVILIFFVQVYPDWWKAWELFHGNILTYILFQFAGIVLIIIILGLYNKINIFKYKVQLYYYLIKQKYIYEILFGILSVSFTGALGQAFGGCIWQIPLIYLNVGGYNWRRFGWEMYPDVYLMIFYSTMSLILFASMIFLYSEKSRLDK